MEGVLAIAIGHIPLSIRFLLAEFLQVSGMKK